MLAEFKGIPENESGLIPTIVLNYNSGNALNEKREDMTLPFFHLNKNKLFIEVILDKS